MDELLQKHKEWLDANEKYPKLEGKKRDVMARLAENYEVETKQSLLNEETNTTAISTYDPLLSPIIRRSTPTLIAFDIFGVQPMKTPSGLAVCRRAVYHNSAAEPVKRSNSKLLTLADASAFDAGTAISTNGVGAGVGVVRYKEGNNVLVQITSGSFAATYSVDDASTYSSEVTTVSAVYDNEAQYQYILKNYGEFATTALAEVAGTNIKELGMVIDTVQVKAESLKLKAQYTDEVMQDVRALYGLDVDSELVQILSDDVNNEINQKHIALFKTRAATGGESTFNYEAKTYGGDADGRWEVEKMYSLYSFVNKIGNQIHFSTMRGPGNFIVTSLDVVARFEALKQWIPAASMGLNVGLSATTFCGMLGRYKVFVDMYQTEDAIYVGYKGTSEWDAGIIFMPYVPLYIKKGMGQDDGQNRMFLNTRYGIAENPFGAHLYYRKINLTNF